MSLIAAGKLVKREMKPLTGMNGPQWLSSMLMRNDSHAGVTVNQDTAISLSTVFNALNLIGDNIGQIPGYVMTEDGNSSKQKFKSHPAYRLVLSWPNRYMHAFTFRKVLMNHACRYDNAFAIIERDANYTPLSLIPIHPDRVAIKIDEAENVFYEVDSKYLISAINMIHVIGYTEDGIVGKPRIEIVRNSLGNALAGEKFAGEFFSKGVNVSGFIKTKKYLKDQDAVERLKKSFIKAVTGSSFGVGVLEEENDWIDNEVKPKEAQLFENRKINGLVVAQTWNIPLPLLKYLEHATYNNVEQLDIQFGKYTLSPWLKNIELEFARKLFTEREILEGNVFIEHDMNVLLRGDMKTRSEYYKTMIEASVYSPNDVRNKEGENGFEGGDVHIIPSGYQTLEQLKAGTTIETTNNEGEENE